MTCQVQEAAGVECGVRGKSAACQGPVGSRCVTIRAPEGTLSAGLEPARGWGDRQTSGGPGDTLRLRPSTVASPGPPHQGLESSPEF